MKKTIIISLLSCAAVLPCAVHAQYENYAVTNVGFNIALCDTSHASGRWSYYTLNLSVDSSGAITGAGTRDDVGDGDAHVIPTNQVSISVLPTARLEAPIISSTNFSTFSLKVGRQFVTLTNETVADAAFLVAPLSDSGLLKGAFVYNYNRTQTVRKTKTGLVFGWKTNEVWYGGQVFGSLQVSGAGMTGSSFIGQ